MILQEIQSTYSKTHQKGGLLLLAESGKFGRTKCSAVVRDQGLRNAESAKNSLKFGNCFFRSDAGHWKDLKPFAVGINNNEK